MTKFPDMIYATAPGGNAKEYWSTEKASGESDYSPEHVAVLARRGAVGHVNLGRRVYVAADDMRKFMVPEGYVPVTQAAADYNYSVVHLKRLARKRVIGSAFRRGKVYISKADLQRYMQGPEGYMSTEQASEAAGFSAPYLLQLARGGEVRTKRHANRVYFHSDDIERLKLPEGYVPLPEAARLSGYSAEHISGLVAKGRAGGILHCGKLYVSLESLEAYKKIPEGYLTTKEAAGKGLSESRTKHLAHTGVISAVRKNNQWLVSAASLQMYLDGPEGHVPLEEAAHRLSISPGNVKYLLNHDKLNGVKHRRKWWVSAESIERRLTGNQDSPGPNNNGSLNPPDAQTALWGAVQPATAHSDTNGSSSNGLKALVLELYDKVAPCHGSTGEIVEGIVLRLNGQSIPASPDFVHAIVREFE